MKILTIFFIFFGLVFYTQVQGISEIDKLKQEIELKNQRIKAIEEDIAKNRLGIAEKQREALTLKKEIFRLEAVIKKLDKDILLTGTKIERTELNLKKLSFEIRETKNEINNKKEKIAESLRQINDLNKTSLLEILLENQNFSDFFNNLDYFEALNNALKTKLLDLKEEKNALEGQEKDETERKKELTSYKEELEDKKAIQGGISKEKNYFLKITKNKETEYKKLVEKREKEKFEILDEINKLEEELRKLIDRASLPKAKSGILAYPVKEPVITQGFGKTSFALFSGSYQDGVHNGVDFRAVVGSEIYSAEDGEIWKTGNTDLSCPYGSYGKWILIKHTNNLATLYAHLSLIKAAENQKVSRGDLIGYSGQTGYATGPHLHFTVYDSRTVRFGPSLSGRCKFLPFGGYLNPLDYL